MLSSTRGRPPSRASDFVSQHRLLRYLLRAEKLPLADPAIERFFSSQAVCCTDAFSAGSRGMATCLASRRAVATTATVGGSPQASGMMVVSMRITHTTRPRSSTAPRTANKRRPTAAWNGWPLLPYHVPERRKQTIRYDGFYANSVRGKLRERQQVEPIPTVLEPASELQRRSKISLLNY